MLDDFGEKVKEPVSGLAELESLSVYVLYEGLCHSVVLHTVNYEAIWLGRATTDEILSM